MQYPHKQWIALVNLLPIVSSYSDLTIAPLGYLSVNLPLLLI